jgi:7,8-dihydroneopterin aldolase/epimerase/oxygenase
MKVATPIPFPPLDDQKSVRITGATVFVRAIRVDAEIGIHDHEYGRTQPLMVDVEMTIDAAGFEHIGDTVNYETIVAKARAVAAEGHLKLVERYAERLAFACLEDPRAKRVRVRVEKPEALAPDAEAAGVELVVERA